MSSNYHSRIPVLWTGGELGNILQRNRNKENHVEFVGCQKWMQSDNLECSCSNGSQQVKILVWNGEAMM